MNSSLPIVTDVVAGVVLVIIGSLLVAGIIPFFSLGVGYSISAGIGGGVLIGVGALQLLVAIPLPLLACFVESAMYRN